MLAKTSRAKVCQSKTVKISTGCGSLYVTLSYQKGRLIEVFATLGKAGGCSRCQLEALTRSVSVGLKYSIPIEDYIEELKGLRCPMPSFGQFRTLSCADALSKILEESSYDSEDTKNT